MPERKMLVRDGVALNISVSHQFVEPLMPYPQMKV